jgi:hypothetical protein
LILAIQNKIDMSVRCRLKIGGGREYRYIRHRQKFRREAKMASFTIFATFAIKKIFDVLSMAKWGRNFYPFSPKSSLEKYPNSGLSLISIARAKDF